MEGRRSRSSRRNRDDPPSPPPTFGKALGACTYLLVSLVIVVVAFVYFLTGLIFLIKYFVAGWRPCSQTTGFQTWCYALVIITMIPANINSLRATYNAVTSTRAIIAIFVNFLIELAFVVYGYFILYKPGPCTLFKQQARPLWQWVQVAWIVKIIGAGVLLTILVVYLIYILGKGCAAYFAAQREVENMASIPEAEVQFVRVEASHEDDGEGGGGESGSIHISRGAAGGLSGRVVASTGRTEQGDSIQLQIVTDSEPTVAEHPVFRPSNFLVQANPLTEEQSPRRGGVNNGTRSSQAENNFDIESGSGPYRGSRNFGSNNRNVNSSNNNSSNNVLADDVVAVETALAAPDNASGSRLSRPRRLMGGLSGGRNEAVEGVPIVEDREPLLLTRPNG